MGLLAVLLASYLACCRLTGTAARLLTPHPAAHRLFADPAYLELVRLVTAAPADAFDTIWDATAGIKLSRDEFVPTEMYSPRSTTTGSAPTVRRCRVFREAFVETDENGFKKTDFALVPGRPTVLFVGDSFTEGLDVASADTFVNVFGRHMKDGGLPGTAVNAGVNGYGALEQMPRSVPESPFERPSALLAPVTALCSPTVSYNILVGLSFVGSAFGVYLLCLFLLDGDGRRAAFLAGAAYALSAPRSSG